MHKHLYLGTKAIKSRLAWPGALCEVASGIWLAARAAESGAGEMEDAPPPHTHCSGCCCRIAHRLAEGNSTMRGLGLQHCGTATLHPQSNVQTLDQSWNI